MLKTIVAAAAVLLLLACDSMQTLTEAEQIDRTIRQQVSRDLNGLNALTAVADSMTYDGFAWRRGEKIEIRQRVNGELQLLEDAQAPEIITTAVKYNIPSFSLVRYQQGWLVVFRTYVSSHCQVVYGYAYRGQLTDTPQCDESLFASQANGQCQSPINAQWQLFKEWFFAESLIAEGNPLCKAKVEQGWQAPQ